VYRFTEEINDDVYFRFNRMNIRNKRFAHLPLPSKSILPVIGVHCNKYGVCNPSKETIAIMAGCCEKTVYNGLQGLQKYPGFEMSQYVTSRGRKANKYLIVPPSMDKKAQSFDFYKSIITGAIWQYLTPKAHALYMVMRHYSFHDQHTYMALEEDDEICDLGVMEMFASRKFDFCEAELDVLAEYAGIGLDTAGGAMEELIRYFLVEKIEEDECPPWKVIIRPQYHYVTEPLNQSIRERYTPKKEKLPVKYIEPKSEKTYPLSI
jgi:hypothetical protein